jgi:putative selenium metabolism protein SsnA
MLVINGKLITWEAENQILEGQAIYIKDDRIVEMGPQAELVARYPQEEQIDARGQYVMPGNICAHTHFYGAYARGMGIPGPPPKDFPEILKRLWWPLDMALDEDAVRYSALVMLVDAIKHGTTSLLDHHASPNFIAGSLDVIAEAVDTSGLRAVLCYEVTDRNGEAGAKAGIAENVRFLESDWVKDNSRLAGTFGMHAALSISDATMQACRDAAPADTGFHIHVAEHEADEYDSLQKYGIRVVDRLQKFDILGPDSIVAHAIHIDGREAAILAETDTWVTHQARSNMNNGVGAAQVESLLRMGVPICLGTDGFTSTMWDEWKTAYLMHKVVSRDPRQMNGMLIAQMGVYNNAALAGKFFPDAPLGLLAPGAHADIIFVDYHPHTPLTAGNLPWQIIFGFNESMVTTTIGAGKVLYRDGELLTLDEAAIAAEARALAPAVWERYESYVGTYD